MITPNTEQQILPTKNRALFNDIIIKAAPGSTDYIGINNVYINEDGNLIICYSTGEEDNVGHVVGADGKDGVSVSSSIINTNGELVITYTDGQIVNLGVVIGAKGDKGDKGDQGEQGIQGIQGEKGEQGPQGLQGVQGVKGDKGDKGDAGAQGPQGKQGIQGVQGKQGERGEDGAKGDKGDTGAKGEKGADGYTPVKGTDYWTPADKQEIINELSTDTNPIPSYWNDGGYLDSKTDDIRETMENAGRNKSSFLFYSDAHWDNGSKVVPALLNYLTKYTSINKTIFGGDIVNDEPTTETLSDRSIMKYLWDWRSQIRDLKHYSVIGNHDDGNKNTATGGATNTIFPIDYVYNFLFAPEENNSGIVREADTYYYFDDTREKTRYLCLDTAYESQFKLSTAQETFIKDSLKSTPENYHIVVVAHIWYMPDYTQSSVRPMPLTGLSATAVSVGAILDNYNARSGEFADCKAKVEFCIGGHIHQDIIGKTDGGIPIVSVECAGLGYRGDFQASAGTITETAVSGVIADYDNDKLTIVRIGRGNSLEIALSTGSSEEIPEEPITPPPAEPTYTNVLDTAGWEVGRLNSSGQHKTDRTDREITGFIYAPTGSTVYFKNITDKNSDYGRTVSHYLEDKTFQTGSSYIMEDTFTSVTLYDDGSIKSYKVQRANVVWLRFCFVDINENSIITVNEPIE